MKTLLLRILSYLSNFCGDPQANIASRTQTATDLKVCSSINEPTTILTTGEELPGTFFNHYQPTHKLIGKGVFGQVREGNLNKIEHQIVLKVSHFRSNNEADNMLKEAIIMRDLNKYPYSPKLYACKSGTDYYLLVQDKIRNGDLYSGPTKSAIQNLSVDRMLKFFRTGFEGLAKFHELGIVHNDIKPANLMAELPCSKIQNSDCRYEQLDEPILYFIDFGFAEYTANIDVQLKGTPHFLSPGRQKD